MKYNLLNRINEKTFKIIDSPEKAYFLGFLWADGHVNKNSLNLEILTSDAMDILPALSKIGDFLVSQRFRSNSSKEQTSIRIYNRKLARYLLEELNYVNKSTSSPSKVLNTIPANMHNYFWRGYFDGDGSFSKSKTNNPNRFYYRMTIYSTYDQDWLEFEKLSQTLGFNFSLERKVRKTKHSYSLVNLGEKQSVLKLGGYLYNNYDYIGLKRKFKIFQDFLTTLQERKFQIPLNSGS
jgi:LAGLIDADG DNA endonuclease family protein